MNMPFVSIIMPIRNESSFISRSLDAVLAQDYPSDCLQVIVVDGASTDSTRQVVLQRAGHDKRVQLLINPQEIVPISLNSGIHSARGEVIIRVDGHAVIAPDYIRRCVDGLDRTGAECVGGPIHTIGETWLARSIAIAQSSPFGVGNAAFRYANTPQYVDTLAFGAYRREVFDRIGFFDEELVRNQDDEFNFRLTHAGGKIWLDPKIRSVYYSRASLRALWKQYFEYGFWKVRVIQKHGRPASWRHLIPVVFVLALVASVAWSLVTSSLLWFLWIVMPYLIVSGTASIWLGFQKGWRYVPLLPLAFATMHLAYGTGFMRGLVKFVLFRRVSPIQTPQR